MVNWKRWMQWPMTPVEGCPTVFQTICSLPPGYHQVGVFFPLSIDELILFSRFTEELFVIGFRSRK